MLISKAMQDIIRVLLNRENVTLREAAREANVSLGIASKIVHQLEATGCISRKKGGIHANFEKLLGAWAHTVSVKELKKIEFTGAEKPQYLIKKIAGIANKCRLEYAFTLFSGTEIVCPFVAPNEIHLYILDSEKQEWEKTMKKNGIFPAEKGNIICFPVDKNYFYGKIKVRDTNIVSLPQLYVDLFSLGGRGKEAAEELTKVMKNV